jgi:hypothetical protein
MISALSRDSANFFSTWMLGSLQFKEHEPDKPKAKHLQDKIIILLFLHNR